MSGRVGNTKEFDRRRLKARKRAKIAKDARKKNRAR